MNGGIGKDFYTRGNSVKRSGRFSEPLSSSPSRKLALTKIPKIKALESPPWKFCVGLGRIRRLNLTSIDFLKELHQLEHQNIDTKIKVSTVYELRAWQRQVVLRCL